jgi:hypothetical protein
MPFVVLRDTNRDSEMRTRSIRAKNIRTIERLDRFAVWSGVLVCPFIEPPLGLSNSS